MFFPPEPSLYTFSRFDRDGNPIDDENDDSSDEESNTKKPNSPSTRKEKKNYNLCTNADKTEDDVNEDVNISNDSTTALHTDFKSSRTGKKPSSTQKKSSSPTLPSTTTRPLDPPPDDYGQYYEDDFQELNLAERAATLRKRGLLRNSRDARDARRGVTYRFTPDNRLMSPPPFSGTVDAIKIGPDGKTGAFVAALVYRLRAGRQTEGTRTLIYSHGNATDIGAMNFMQAVLAKGLQANVIMYDYSGYGASGGEPMEANTYRDIKNVYEFAKTHMVRDKDESKIVIYGQSVGSGPSCYLCAKKPNVGGLVLHSPFMSGMRVLTPSRILGCLDVFPNIDRIKNVSCPVMIIHGELDEEVPINHGKSLHGAVHKDLRRPPWWVPGRGHNDLTDGRANLIEYIERMNRFMESLA